MLDALASLSILLFICIVLLPLWTRMENDRQDLLRHTKAHHVLYQNLERYSHSAEIEESIYDTTTKSSFVTTIEPLEHNLVYVEGCVTYKNSKKKNISVCDVTREGAWFYAD